MQESMAPKQMAQIGVNNVMLTKYSSPTVTYLGIFIIKVSLFDHKTQGLCFCDFLNIKFKWNKFKWEILDNLNYDNFHGGGDFSHAYVIMHKYFG